MDSNKPPPQYYRDDEITLKELIIKIQELWTYLWSRKFRIIGMSALGASLLLAHAIGKKTTYTSGISFMVTESSRSQQRNRNIFGQLEFGFIENNKITELARSGVIIHQVLLTRAIIKDREDYIANHIINIYDLHDEWNKEVINSTYEDLHLDSFYFIQHDISKFSRKELRALSTLHEFVGGNKFKSEKGILSISYNDETGIFRLNIKAQDESLALRLVEEEFEQLKKFYIGGTINKTRDNRDRVAVETDSIYNILTKSERLLASGKDRSRGVVSSLQGLQIDNLEREVARLDQEYSQSLTNLRDLDVLLNSETPEFQIIDQTFFPIMNAPSKIRSILLGGFIGGFLACCFYLCSKFIRDAMNE